MGSFSIICSLILLSVAASFGQFYDYFQEPFFKADINLGFNIQNLYTTKKPSVFNSYNINNDYNNNNVKSTTRRQYLGEEWNGNRDQTTKERGNRRKSTTTTGNNENTHTTTSKSGRKTVNNHYNNENTYDNSNTFGVRRVEEEPIQENQNYRPRRPDIYYPTEKPKTTKTVNYYDYNNNNYENNNGNSDTINLYTSQNPFHNRPGVKPAVVNGPPITNRPVTRWPSSETTKRSTTRTYQETTKRPETRRTTRPSAARPADAIAFPGDTSLVPNFLTGVDEDTLSEAAKRKYVELAERMCDNYKSINSMQPEAIPLLPSPDPVKVTPSCRPSSVPLVVGGKVVNIKDFPHMALVGWKKIDDPGYSWKCGGSLISDQFVLTAAHCVYQERDDSVVVGPPQAVQLGSSYLDDPGALVVRITSIIRHPKYKLPKSYNDIALLKLTSKVTFSEVVKPACLGSRPRVGEDIIATGWGHTQFGGEQSLQLRSVRLPVWAAPECARALGVSRKLPAGPGASQLCAGERRGGKDTCQGDSGGPAMVQDGCSWRVVAVTSLGRSCGAPDTPGLYAIVQKVFVAAHVFGNIHDSDASNNDRHNDNNSNKYDTYNNNNRDDSANIYHYESTSKRNNFDNNHRESKNYGYLNENINDVNNKRQSPGSYNENNNDRNSYLDPSINSNNRDAYNGGYGRENSRHHKTSTTDNYNNYKNYFNSGRIWQ